MFAAVFSVVKEDTNSEICFYHIDGKGIGCILADAHPGQAWTDKHGAACKIRHRARTH